MFCKTNSFFIFVILLLFILSSCANLRTAPRYQLRDGYYKLAENKAKLAKVYIKTLEDSIVVFTGNEVRKNPIATNAKLIRESFDLDIITVLFKYRPAIENLPRQLTTDFNGNVYTGYRIDRFVRYLKPTPAGPKVIVKHKALTIGLFAGIGSTSITPWTTNNQTIDEYNGLVLSKGIAFMAGINSLTVGIGVGWDTLTDRDKDIWIYQNKPWYGLTFGLSIN